MRKQPLSGKSYPPSASISTSMSVEMSDASTKLKGKDGDVVHDGAVEGAEVIDGTTDGAEFATEKEHRILSMMSGFLRTYCLGLAFLVFPCGADSGNVPTYSAMAAARSSVHEIRRR